MKLAFVTLMSCLIAVSWQQHNQRHQSGANPYWSRPQYHQQLQSPYYHQNYPSFYPNYYRGPYSPLSAPSYPNYYQQQQQPQQPFYKQQRPSQLDELKLAALLSQLSQEQQSYQQQNDQPVFIVQQKNEQNSPQVYNSVNFFKNNFTAFKMVI